MRFAGEICGLRIASEVALPALCRLEAGPGLDREPDAAVVLTAVPLELDVPYTAYKHYQITKDAILVRMPGVGRALVRSGRLVQVDPFTRAGEGDVRNILLYAALIALFHQRDSFPFHGSLLERDGDMVLLVGGKGSGIAALSAYLEPQGYSLVSNGTVLLPLTASQAHSTRIYFPRWQIPRGSNPTIAALDGFNAIGRLRRHARDPGLLELMDQETAFLECASRFLLSATCFDFPRPQVPDCEIAAQFEMLSACGLAEPNSEARHFQEHVPAKFEAGRPDATQF